MAAQADRLLPGRGARRQANNSTVELAKEIEPFKLEPSHVGGEKMYHETETANDITPLLQPSRNKETQTFSLLR